MDTIILQRLSKFIEDTGSTEISKNKIDFYWSVGDIIREIYYSDALDNEDRELFFENVRFRLDGFGELFPKNDLKRNRNIPRQFFKLAGYSLSLAKQMAWSQWSYIFDNKYILQNTEFDEWFGEMLRDWRL